jgi:hypothetical protein
MQRAKYALCNCIDSPRYRPAVTNGVLNTEEVYSKALPLDKTRTAGVVISADSHDVLNGLLTTFAKIDH